MRFLHCVGLLLLWLPTLYMLVAGMWQVAVLILPAIILLTVLEEDSLRR